MSTLPNLKGLPFGGAGAIADADQLAYLSDLDLDLTCILNNTDLQNQFLAEYRVWLATTKNNTWAGIEKFPHAVFCNATTEAFDKFYLRNNHRRFRCFRGEYMYHILTWRNCFPKWLYLDQAPLDPMDAIVISLPFSDTGGQHEDLYDILLQCNRMGIPVLLDCAYFGICHSLHIDVDQPCITDITFSLSKSMPLSHSRVGMRLTRVDDDDPLFVVNKTNYTNRVSAYIGLKMIQEFGPDYIADKYTTQQQQWCQELGVRASNSVIFGLGDQSWNRYDRGAGNNRLSFHRYLATGSLPDQFGL